MAVEQFVAPDLGRVGFVELTDGQSLALGGGLKGFLSNDRGRTWQDEYPIMTKEGRPLVGGGNSSIIRLASGKLAIQSYRPLYPDRPAAATSPTQIFCATSDDEGRTRSDERPINLPGALGGPYHDGMIQLAPRRRETRPESVQRPAGRNTGRR